MKYKTIKKIFNHNLQLQINQFSKIKKVPTKDHNKQTIRKPLANIKTLLKKI